ncbi:MAG: glycosyltransferase family 2 protein [Anaerolineae bacterium]
MTSPTPQVTGVILTLNEARHITACIESLCWADDLVVLDSYSQDATVELARGAGARVYQHAFENYSQQRNVALELTADADWIFFVDADERATPELGAEIREVIDGCKAVGWWVPRHNYIFGHRMRGAGWWPDYQLRLLRPDHAHYDPRRAVHEEAQLEGSAAHLTQPLIHYNYETLQEFHARQQRYTDYDARVLLEKGVRPRIYTPYTQVPRHFWWRFVTLQGWRDGFYGLLLSTLMAYYEMIKYRKARRLWRRHRYERCA